MVGPGCAPHNLTTPAVIAVPCCAGSGKTFVLDLFLRTLPTLHYLPPQQPSATSTAAAANTAPPAADGSSGDGGMVLRLEAERLHFHTFMLGVHQQLHQLQQALPKVVGRSRAGLPVYRWGIRRWSATSAAAQGVATVDAVRQLGMTCSQPCTSPSPAPLPTKTPLHTPCPPPLLLPLYPTPTHLHTSPTD